MSERDLLDGLNDSLSIDELMRVPEGQGIIDQDARLARLRGSQERVPNQPDFGLDDDFLDKVKKFEGYSTDPKWDYRQYSSGWGTRASPGERPSRDEHERRLRDELGKAAEFVDAQVPDLPEGVRKAMISLTFNAGGDWAKSGLGSQLRQGDYEGAKQTFLQYNKAGGQTLQGLQDRRTAEAAWFGPENYDTEDRTAVGIGGSRGYAPETTTVPDPATGRRRMAEPRGIMDLLTGGQQPQGADQPQGGLLGMLGNPETMSYLAMILKGANPYSNLDPNAMLSNAQTLAMRREILRQQQMEQARDNARADKALGLRESELGLARTEREAREAERIRLKQEALDLGASQRKKDTEVFSDLAGRPRPPDATTDPTAVAVPAAPFEALTDDQKIDLIDQKLAKDGENMSPAGVNRLQKMRENLAKPPSASMQKQMTTDENAIPVYDAVGRKIDQALELAPKVASGFRATLQAGPAGRFMGSAAPQETKDTIEFQNITSQFAIENMSQTMKGATSDKEMFKNLSIAADERNPMEIRMRALQAAKQRNEELKAVASNRLRQMQEGTYGRKQKPTERPTESGGGGGSDPLDIR